MLLLIPICLLMYVFAFTAEKIRVFYCVLEFLGLYDGYKYSTRNTIIWVVVIVLFVVLFIVAFKLINSDEKFLKRYRILDVIPYIIICLNVVSCFYFPKINQQFLQIQHGLGSVIAPYRGIDYLLGFSNKDTSGAYTEPNLSLLFEIFDQEEVVFYVKLVDIDDETKQYVFCNEDKLPQKLSMGNPEAFLWNINGFTIDLEKIIPGYIDTPENRRLINYKVIIFNENESKTFYIYYDELHKKYGSIKYKGV